MSGAFTAKNYNIKKAPKKITLLGDRTKPEPAQHIIAVQAIPIFRIICHRAPAMQVEQPECFFVGFRRKLFCRNIFQ